MYHSVTINGKNTWNDYHMIPANGIYLPPPPEQKRTTIDLKTGNGLLDVSTVLTGYPLFQNRSGELQYLILDPWDLEEQGIGGSLNLEAVKKRIKKNFSSSYVDTFFNALQNMVYDDDRFTEKFVTVVYGINETQTAVGVVTVGNSNPSRSYVKSDGRIQTTTSGNVGCGYLTTNGNFLGYKDIRDGWNQIVNTGSSDWIAPFSFNNVPTTGSSTSYVASYLPFSNTTNATYNGSNGMTSWISANVYASSSSNTIVYPKNLFKTKTPSALHTVSNPYDVYSQLLSDIHGKQGTMIFEDDPDWHYQGIFAVRSMETNSIRRAVSIGYEVSPYKIKNTSITGSSTAINSSEWTTFNYSASEIGNMPVHPKVQVTSMPSNSSLTIEFSSPAGQTPVITKTVTAAQTYTWADVIVYNNSLRIRYKGSADSGYSVTHTITPGRL